MTKKMKTNNGEVAVAIVRLKKTFTAKIVDFTDYTNPRITAVIPCWKDKNGNYSSVKTGNPISMGANDDERSIFPGTAFRYPDGEEIIFTRNGLGEKYFATREGNSGELRSAFGE